MPGFPESVSICKTAVKGLWPKLSYCCKKSRTKVALISGLCTETPPPPAAGASKVGQFLLGQ